VIQIEIDDVDNLVVKVVIRTAVVKVHGDPTLGNELVVQLVDGIQNGEGLVDGQLAKTLVRRASPILFASE